MSEPVVPPVQSTDATEIDILRRVNADLLQKSATRKARIQELETSVGTLIAKTTEAEARIKALTIDGPVNDLCESLSKAPKTLRAALESDYRIEMRDNVLTLVNPSDGKQAMHEGKPVPFERDAIMKLLLSATDKEKQALFSSILIASKASGSGGSQSQRTVAPASKHRFGLGQR